VNDAPDPEQVLDFWFGPGDAAAILERNGVRWWRADPAFDAEIRERFGAWREQALAGALDAWRSTPRGTLALILLLDQFSRNLYRGDARAFAHDALARSWTHALLARGAGANSRRSSACSAICRWNTPRICARRTVPSRCSPHCATRPRRRCAARSRTTSISRASIAT